MTTSITSPTHAGPRPLQLVEGAVPPGPATAPLSSSRHSSYPSPISTGLPTPPQTVTTPRSDRRPTSLTNSRRQSSISYFPSDHLAELRSPSPRLPLSFSPLSPTPTPSPGPSKFPFRGGVRRSSSLSVRTGETIQTSPLFSKGANKGDRRSLGSENVPLASPGVGPAPDRAPLTLTEKHADLLRFIAQKESKCLELRSQLTIHEAELRELKRKWERIVSRGMDRAYSSSPSSANTSPNLSSNTHGAAHGLAAALLPAGGNTGAVLDGIKGGVQDLGRLLAAGLDLSGGAMDDALSSGTTHIGGNAVNVSRSSVVSTSTVKMQRHVMTPSVSSVSTSTTAVSDSTAGTRLSQSSVSSISFLEDEDKVISEEPEEEAQQDPSPDNSAHSTIKEQIREENVVTANVSMSPLTSDKSTKGLRRRSREVPKLPELSETSTTKAKTEMTSPTSPTSAGLPRPAKQRIAIKRASTGLAPSSGLVPLSQPMSSWMGSVGKKWEEIQKGETFTKSQKRASLLLSDVSHSLFGSLASPTTPSSPHIVSPSQCQRSHSSATYSSSSNTTSSSSISITTNPFLATISPLSPSPSPLSSSTSQSLLDDDFEEPQGVAYISEGKGLGDVLVPTTVSPSANANKEASSNATKSLIDDDDDWNW